MSESKKTPVTLAEVFKYAELYGVDITVSYDPIFPGQYILRFRRNGLHACETTQRIDPDCHDFDGLCRYTLTAGCEKINRNVVENYVSRRIQPKFEEATDE